MSVAPRGSAFFGGTASAGCGPLAPPLEVESMDHRYIHTLADHRRRRQQGNRDGIPTCKRPTYGPHPERGRHSACPRRGARSMVEYDRRRRRVRRDEPPRFPERSARRRAADETVLRRAVREAVLAPGLNKRAGCHTFGPSFATALLDTGYDIRTIQGLLGHSDVAGSASGPPSGPGPRRPRSRPRRPEGVQPRAAGPSARSSAAPGRASFGPVQPLPPWRHRPASTASPRLPSPRSVDRQIPVRRPLDALVLRALP